MNIEEQKKIAKKTLSLVMNQINAVRKTKEGKGKKKPENNSGVRIGFLGTMKGLDIPTTPTGSLALDAAIGVGGYPQGRIIEIFGPESSAKTTTSIHAIVEAQRLGHACAFIDVEGTLDISYAKALGVDADSLLFCQPNDGDEAMRIVDTLVRSGVVKLIVVDSVASLVPSAEFEGEITDCHMGMQARLMSQCLRQLTMKTVKTGTTIIFINQTRCIAKDTLCLINGSFSEIKNIKTQDLIVDKVVSEIYDSGKVSGVKLLAKNRSPIEISNNHLQPVISKNGYEEKTGQNIQISDWLIQPILDYWLVRDDIEYIKLDTIIDKVELLLLNRYKKVELPRYLDENLAFIIGAYCSDGSFKEYPASSDYGIQWGEVNKERYNLIFKHLSRIFPNVLDHPPNITLNGRIYLEFFKELGLKRYRRNKGVPDIILQSKRSVIIAFLRGAFFDSHGFNNDIQHQKGFIYTSDTLENAYKISTILYYFGIFANIKYPTNYGAQKGYYLYITGSDAVEFNKLIGFAERRKDKIAKKFNTSINARGKFDVIPCSFGVKILKYVKEKYENITNFPKFNNLNMCRYKKFNFCRTTMIDYLLYFGDKSYYLDLLQNNRFAPIVDIKKTEFEALDIEVDHEDSLFIAGQYLTHNSTIGLYKNPITTSGGNALKFYSTVRLKMARQESIKQGDKVIGAITKVEVIKNKVAPPFKTAYFNLIYGKGIDQYTDIINTAADLNILDKSGAWYKYKDESIGQGLDNTIETLKAKPELLLEIKNAVTTRIVENRGNIELDTIEDEVDPETGEVAEEE